jgi:D-tagatose-1,6-bisphosphate aldolase subunit GatZ/KbaZ
MTDLVRIIAANRRAHAVALPSVCSAQPDVLAASLSLAQQLDFPVIIEATSNQVNHLGGYTGQTPVAFVAMVRRIADQVGCDMSRVTLGGDHLGPQVWRAGSAIDAMSQACEMMQSYVEAGFTKIHLDCSEPCGDDPAMLTDDICAARAAQLAKVCETYAPNPSLLSYIVGTEVPPPGGAREAEHETVRPTHPDAARATLMAHHAAFVAAGQSQAWARVCGLVVQPGVEFGAQAIDHLPDDVDMGLRDALFGYSGVALEAHSTDYQRDTAFDRLAQMGFAILKVGPALTFAYRRALYALQAVMDHVDGPSTSGMKMPSLPDVMERVMCDQPAHWQGHYFGDAQQLLHLRHHGLADRIRYYWTDTKATEAVERLLGDATARTLPLGVLAQHFSWPVIHAAHQMMQDTHTDLCGLPQALIRAEIQATLAPYFLPLANGDLTC